MQDDWRLTNQMKYLHRAKLMRVPFSAALTNDHEHCEFCWAKFGEDQESLHVGYCTLDKYRWICETCFSDFSSMFEWEIISDCELT